MKSFEIWLSELINDDRWFELLRHYKNTTIEAAAKKVYAQLVADSIVDVRPMSENRKHVYNILVKNPGDKPVLKNWAAKALEIQEAEKEKEWQPVTWEKRAEYLEKLQEIIKGSTMMSGVPRPTYKQQAEEGLERPKNMPPYPVTNPMEYYIKERHLAYIEENYDPRTGDKLPGAIEESLYNILYDEKNYKNYAKVFGL